MSFADDNAVVWPSEDVPLLRAHPHQWGVGLVHRIDVDRDQTMCGQAPSRCPGDKFFGHLDQITCKSCLRSIESEPRLAEAQQRWEEKVRARDSEQASLFSKSWEERKQEREEVTRQCRAKRALVLKRAEGLCEGCGERHAVHVHHKRYPGGYSNGFSDDVLPGSSEWIALEKLFDLVAICEECHADIHPRLRETL